MSLINLADELKNLQIEKYSLLAKVAEYERQVQKHETKQKIVIEVFGEKSDMMRSLEEDEIALQRRAEHLSMLHDMIGAWEECM